MTAALIPAAGFSTRMGRPKLTLPIGGRAVIEHVVAAFRAAGVERVLVVTGPHVADVAALAERAGASVLRLAEPTPDMRATVVAGLNRLEAAGSPRDWFLSPADHPTLDATVIDALLAARTARPDQSIFIPTFDGRRGHPALIAWAHVAGLRTLPSGTGLNSYFRQHTAATHEVAVASAEVLRDLDTPADYARLLRDRGEGK